MKPSELDVAGYRDGLKGVDPQFVKRWSPRSMSGEGLSENPVSYTHLTLPTILRV